MKLSATFKRELTTAALQLDDACTHLKLDGIYAGIAVYLHKPVLSEVRLKDILNKEVGIDRSGAFWLYIENLLG